MQLESRPYLGEIISACDEIASFAGHEADNFLNSRRDALAIERLLEIIGEAISRLRDKDPAVFEQITDGLAIIGMRNVIAHGYDAVDPARIVHVIRFRLPDLQKECLQLLG